MGHSVSQCRVADHSPRCGCSGHTTPATRKVHIESLTGAAFCRSLTTLIQSGSAAGPLGCGSARPAPQGAQFKGTLMQKASGKRAKWWPWAEGCSAYTFPMNIFLNYRVKPTGTEIKAIMQPSVLTAPCPIFTSITSPGWSHPYSDTSQKNCERGSLWLLGGQSPVLFSLPHPGYVPNCIHFLHRE